MNVKDKKQQEAAFGTLGMESSPIPYIIFSHIHTIYPTNKRSRRYILVRDSRDILRKVQQNARSSECSTRLRVIAIAVHVRLWHVQFFISMFIPPLSIIYGAPVKAGSGRDDSTQYLQLRPRMCPFP
jgi:hypothetical protein